MFAVSSVLGLVSSRDPPRSQRGAKRGSTCCRASAAARGREGGGVAAQRRKATHVCRHSAGGRGREPDGNQRCAARHATRKATGRTRFAPARSGLPEAPAGRQGAAEPRRASTRRTRLSCSTTKLKTYPTSRLTRALRDVRVHGRRPALGWGNVGRRNRRRDEVRGTTPTVRGDRCDVRRALLNGRAARGFVAQRRKAAKASFFRGDDRDGSSAQGSVVGCVVVRRPKGAHQLDWRLARSATDGACVPHRTGC